VQLTCLFACGVVVFCVVVLVGLYTLLHVSAPILLSRSPATGTTKGGTTMVLGGTNFGGTQSTNATIGGIICEAIGDITPSVITCKIPEGQGQNLPIVVHRNPIYQSASKIFDYFRPFLATVTPSGPTLGSVTITLTGSDFGLFGNVTVGGLECEVTDFGLAWDHDTVECTLPAGEGVEQAVQITVADQDSEFTKPFDYFPPVIGTINPDKGPTAGGTPVTITGTNLGITATVTFGGVPATPISNNQNHT